MDFTYFECTLHFSFKKYKFKTLWGKKVSFSITDRMPSRESWIVQSGLSIGFNTCNSGGITYAEIFDEVSASARQADSQR